MVKISAIRPYIPKNPQTFCTNPYDVIDKEEEIELKKNPDSLIHLILPDGNDEEKYQNAKQAYKKYKNKGIIHQIDDPSVFVYRQESSNFSQQGFILGISLRDYEEGNVVKHEHTREKPLKDRMKHINSTKVAAGLVWSVYQDNKRINAIQEKIKKKSPIFDFELYGYRHLLWQETDQIIIEQLAQLLKDKQVYIADGHHRAASAAKYRQNQLSAPNVDPERDYPWNYLLSYLASDNQVRILAYNRVIREIDDTPKDFLKKLEKTYEIQPVNKAFNPKSKHEIAMCLKGQWYSLKVKSSSFESRVDSLDVSILQNEVIAPILNIKDVRASDNIFFVGGVQDPELLGEYVKKKGNTIVFNLFPVYIKDLEYIAESGGVMPPKSTWFDPKVLSGLLLYDLNENS
ncbi:MAG: DUF1015 domain-containing protein [Promethearchaeota archaeon]|nr:MAG: DUF1015 domain-containing protein [Candidatus Lokiarchaeota archaeon]